MAVNTTDVTIPVGGGLGNLKIHIIEVNGTYETGGFKYDTSYYPIIIIPEGGYGAYFDEKKRRIKLSQAGALSGGHIKLPVGKIGSIGSGGVSVTGDITESAVSDEGVVDPITSTNNAAVDVIGTGEVINVEGGSAKGAGEIESGSLLEHLRILIICSGTI